MQIFAEIAYTGLVSVILYPLRSIATALCLLAVLVPYLVGLGVSQGIQREALLSIQEGADLYVSGSQFGQQVPVPLSAIPDIRAIEGVIEVTPRIVGPIVLGLEHVPAVLVGIPVAKLPPNATFVEGRLFRNDADPDLVLGSQIARRLRVKPGDRLPPFYRSSQGDKVSTVVGIFRSDVSFWQANLIFTSLENAAMIFDQPGQATSLLVECRPGYAESVRDRIMATISFPTRDAQRQVRPRVVTRSQLDAMLPQGLLHREGVFNLHFVLAFTIAIVVLLVTSGVGLTERRREIGILKAIGWQTDEVMLRSAVESLVLSLIGALVSIVLAFMWLKWFNGYFIAGVFLAGVGVQPDFPVPFRLTPLPVLLSFILAFAIVMTGTLYSTWRAATAPPRDVMR